MIDNKSTYAVIGASNDQEKYGYKVMKDLLDGGYRVIPINPKGEEILGQKTYVSVAEVPQKIDVAVMVVPPEVGLKVLPDIRTAGIKMVWFQPGSESEAEFDYCKGNGIQYVANACIMVKRKDTN